MRRSAEAPLRLILPSAFFTDARKDYGNKWRRRRNNFWQNAADIPTGVAFDIHKQIERQRAKRAAAPDNFAPQTECANTHFQEKDPFADIRAV